jgi:D-threo-aldose 1-dehydrogenase
MDPKSKRKLGKSGLAVTVLGCGGGPLGDMYALLDEAAAIETVDAAYNGGITLFDTSPFYGHGLSERRFGSA